MASLGTAPERMASPLQRFVESSLLRGFVVAAILANAITLGLECIPAINDQYGQQLKAIDHAFLAIFVAELLLKLVTYRASFFRQPWNWFDAIIVAVSLVPNAGAWSVLRVLRLFRLFSAVPSMRGVVEALLKAMPGMGAIVAVLGVVFYVGAVAVTQLFGKEPSVAQYFGSLDRSAYTLFSIMTLDGWTDISNATMEAFPLAWVFFVPFIVITSFAVLNLFIAVIVEAMGSQKTKDGLQQGPAMADDVALLTEEVRALRQELKAMGLAKNGSDGKP